MFAKVVIDIKNQAVDRFFTYRIPKEMEDRIRPGKVVSVPFGRSSNLRKGYVCGLSETSEYPESQVKNIAGIEEKHADLEEQLMALAIWMRDRYGGTLFQAISTVLPSKMKVEQKKERIFEYIGDPEELKVLYNEAVRKKHYAKARLLRAFLDDLRIPGSVLTDRLSLSMTVIKPYIEKGLVRLEYLSEIPEDTDIHSSTVELNEDQLRAVRYIENTDKPVTVLHGITGSGKTEVYLKLIEDTLAEGKEAIVLIPEIALTYQTVMRFYSRFGSLVSMVHSRLSKGEKWEQFSKAEKGEVRVMIGPRSALFTPFRHLGLVIIDEFHEASYRSEQIPRYDTAETALERVKNCGGKVVLGSATPSCEAYFRALQGEYELAELTKRAVPGAVLPKVTVVDLREELKNGNRSIFSAALKDKIQDRLGKGEQVMLFLNRRGFAGAVSCRSCGEAVSCSHCSVPMHYHRNGTLQCHICGHSRPMVRTCPACGSSLIGTFGIGTERVEESVKELFPEASVLRMDADTTKGKDGHRELLEKFQNHEADILVGTQMIVKGHDFENVTLVGILAADLSLNVPDYESSERTFQLLTQAEGRAGRGGKPGECIVQTYCPDHYAVQTAAEQDFVGFYRQEMVFRKQMKYPPCGYVMHLTVSGADPEGVHRVMEEVNYLIRRENLHGVEFLGPSEADIYKIKDMYREVFYIKSSSLKELLAAKNRMEELCARIIQGRKIYYSFT